MKEPKGCLTCPKSESHKSGSSLAREGSAREAG